MIKALVDAGAYTSGNIPLSLAKQTNNKYVLNGDNSISIRTTDLTEIKANVTVKATSAGDLTLQAFANGVAIPGAFATQTLANAGTATLTINDIIRTIPSAYDYERISFTVSGACTLVGGDVILEYER